LNLAVIASLQIDQNTIPLPSIIWFGVAITVITGLMTSWLTYWLLGCRRWQDMGLAFLATISLQHIRFVGAWQAVFGRSHQWKRTNKFQVFPNRWRALQSCQTELGLGLLCLLVVGTLLTIAQADPNWVWALIGGFSLGAIAYFAAAAMAWIGEQELRRTLALSRNQKSPGLESVPTRLTQHLNNRG
ncbi:MAG: hypothetical protein RLZZ490_1393, partial [Cyanobacteriota bacterium]